LKVKIDDFSCLKLFQSKVISFTSLQFSYNWISASSDEI
jgi:hypothetical protein